MSPEKREFISLLIRSRRSARKIQNELDVIHQDRRQSRRRARQYRETGEPIMIRNAEVIEARLKDQETDLKRGSELLAFIGETVRMFADDIDGLLSTRELLDLLEVNPVDRAKVNKTAGITDIVFIHGLEDSATYRGADFKSGPLANAMIYYMILLTDTNPEFRRKTTEGLFGKGGMFEFVPTYRREPGGNFVRNPPKLRLADDYPTALLASQ